MNKTVLLAAAAVLVMTAGASAQPAHPTAGVVGAVKAPAPNMTPSLKVLYSQNSSGSGSGFSSQNFTSGTFSKTYNCQEADDFIVPTGQTWKVEEVDVTGFYYNGAGPATSENVIFYKDKNGVPGKAVKHGTFMSVVGTDTSGSFTIMLPTKLKLKAGHYWVSVQANQNFATTGQWAWEGRSTISNDQAEFQQPGNGYATGCTTWTANGTCFGVSDDLMFDLKGKP